MIAGLESFGVKKNNSSPNAIHVVRPLAVDDFRDQSVDIRLDAWIQLIEVACKSEIAHDRRIKSLAGIPGEYAPAFSIGLHHTSIIHN